MTATTTRKRGKTAARPAQAATGSVDSQPVARVEWIDRDELHANDYNPNHVAPTELALLKLSIIEDGWTQPIVARPDGEIVDGFHRWTCAADPAIAAMTGGKLPVVRISPDPAQQRMATIRHNRARGTHAVVRMAEIVEQLAVEMKLGPDEIAKRLGMEGEEVQRLLDRGLMTKRGAAEDGEFNKGWVPG